jgi:hypothetical protein
MHVKLSGKCGEALDTEQKLGKQNVRRKFRPRGQSEKAGSETNGFWRRLKGTST